MFYGDKSTCVMWWCWEEYTENILETTNRYWKGIKLLFRMGMLALAVFSIVCDSWLVTESGSARQGLFEECKIKSSNNNCFAQGSCSLCFTNSTEERCKKLDKEIDEVVTICFIAVSIVARVAYFLSILINICVNETEKQSDEHKDLEQFHNNVNRLADTCDLIAVVVYFCLNVPPSGLGKLCAYFGIPFYYTLARALPVIIAILWSNAPIFNDWKTIKWLIVTAAGKLQKCSCKEQQQTAPNEPEERCAKTCCNKTERHSNQKYFVLWNLTNVLVSIYCLLCNTWVAGENDIARKGLLHECRLTDLGPLTPTDIGCAEYNSTKPPQCQFLWRKNFNGAEIFTIFVLVVAIFCRFALSFYFYCTRYDIDNIPNAPQESIFYQRCFEDVNALLGLIAIIWYVATEIHLPGNLCSHYSSGFHLFIATSFIGCTFARLLMILACFVVLIVLFVFLPSIVCITAILFRFRKMYSSITKRRRQNKDSSTISLINNDIDEDQKKYKTSDIP